MSLNRAIAIVIFVSAPAVAETSFYQCKDKWGQPVFSQRPCGEDATQGSVNAPAESGSQQSDQEGWAKVSAGNAIREAEREIDRRENRVDQLEKERDTKIAALDGRQENARNNLAGAQFRESLATEMQAVNSQYQGKIDREIQQIGLIRNQIDRVSEAAR